MMLRGALRRRRLPALAGALCAVVLFSALAAPQASFKAYFASNFTDTAYQQAAVKAMGTVWKPASPLPAGKKTVVITTIARDGKIVEARYNLQSGSEAFDASAMAAVKAVKLPPLPKSFAPASVEVHWHFEVSK